MAQFIIPIFIIALVAIFWIAMNIFDYRRSKLALLQRWNSTEERIYTNIHLFGDVGSVHSGAANSTNDGSEDIKE
jgi:hypothetical protein